MSEDGSLSKELIETFNQELASLTEHICLNLNKITEGPSNQNLEKLMEEISQIGRTIKVSAFSIGIENIGEMAECIEKLFAPSRRVSPELIALISKAVYLMRTEMHNFIEKKPSSTDFKQTLTQLDHYLIAEEKKETLKNKEIVHSPMENNVSLNSAEDEAIIPIIETFKAEFEEHLMTMTEGLLQLERKSESNEDYQDILKEIFRIAHNIKGSARAIGVTDVGEIAHHIETIFAALQKKTIPICHEIIDLCLRAIDYMNKATQCYFQKKPLPFDLNNFLMQLSHFTESDNALPSFTQSATTQLPEHTKNNKFSPMQKQDEFDSIRVSLKNIDKISVYVEEMQMIKIILEEYNTKLIQLNFKLEHLAQSWEKNTSNLINYSKNEIEHLEEIFLNKFELEEINSLAVLTRELLARELRQPINEFTLLLNGLQDEVRTLRLVPVNTHLRYLSRVVRDLSLKLNKRVNLEIKSNNVKIDKLIIEGLQDPLIHLIRNAIDHGIESTAIRQAAGKSPEGTIIIEVDQEDNQIIFKISDDGSGINLDAVRLMALKKKLITQVDIATLTDEDLYEFLFKPGFSTQKIATEISGRGIGLDVVRSNLHQLKGEVTLKSAQGKGTVFFLQVPLSLVTERGLIISCSGQVFAVITSSVECILLLKKKDIVRVEGSPTVLINKQPVLLFSLATLLCLEEHKATKESFSVVVIKQNDKQIAIIVDEVIGEKEIIIKPLQEPLANIPCIIGATLTGSNQINFVLNSSEMIKRVLLK